MFTSILVKYPMDQQRRYNQDTAVSLYKWQHNNNNNNINKCYWLMQERKYKSNTRTSWP